jgi:ribose transport system substrate-binding protein
MLPRANPARKDFHVRSMLRFSLCLLTLLSATACEEKAQPTSAPKPASAPAKPLRIAVVPKGTAHDFWKSVHAGAERAAKDLGGIEATWRGPEREDDREQQISLVQNLISSKYDAIVLAPLDDTALVGPVKQAAAAGIPVVVIDSGLKAEAGKDFVSFVATDNYKGGQLAAKRLAEVMGSKGKALLLRYNEGSASTTQREQGFVDGLKDFKDVQLIDPHRYAGVTRATAQEASENLLSANSDITGVFCPNESSTFGMLLALRGRGLAGKVLFVGFDSSEPEVAALRNGELHGLILQDPIKMGDLGLRAAVDKLRGKPVDPRIDTGVMVVTKDNMDSPEARQLLSPDLKTMLGEK